MRRLASLPFIVRLALCLAIVFIPLAAFAQDVVDAPAPAPVITQPDVVALTPMVLDFIGHAKQGRIALAVVAGLILVSHLKRPEGKGHEEGARTSLGQLRGSAAIGVASGHTVAIWDEWKPLNRVCMAEP